MYSDNPISKQNHWDNTMSVSTSIARRFTLMHKVIPWLAQERLYIITTSSSMIIFLSIRYRKRSTNIWYLLSTKLNLNIVSYRLRLMENTQKVTCASTLSPTTIWVWWHIDKLNDLQVWTIMQHRSQSTRKLWNNLRQFSN